MARHTAGARVAVLISTSAVAGVAALVVLFQVIAAYQHRLELASRPPEVGYALVASRELYPGIPILEQDLYAVEIPVAYLDPDVLRSPELAVGRTPRERVLANEFLRLDRLADPGAGVGLHTAIPRGMRAISIDLGDGRALAGLLHPGDYVDVLVTLRPDEGGDRTVRTLTVLDVVAVLAVNDRVTEEPTAADAAPTRRYRPSVTLAVMPAEAEALAHAAKVGTITLTLRNREDASAGTASGTDWRDILSEPAAPGVPIRRTPKPDPAVPGMSMQVCRGKVCETVWVPYE